MWLSLGVFTTIRSNFNYFGHSYNYDATIEIFILPIRWFLGLFSSINILICPISHNKHQINHILKILYVDINFYVCINIIFMICYIYHKYILCVYWLCVCMYSIHIMNLKINIWIQNYNYEFLKLLVLFKNICLSLKL